MLASGFVVVFLAVVSTYIVEIPHLETGAAAFYLFWLAFLVGRWWRA